MTITDANYFSTATDIYMSNSQWKVWRECPAQAHARFIRHVWQPEKTKPLAVGSLVDALLLEPDAESRVLAEYEDLLTKANTKAGIAKGGPERVPNADSKLAYQMAEKIKSIPAIMAIVDACDHQAQYTFELGGMAWKCRLDLLNLDAGWIWDLKTTASTTDEKFVERIGARGNFIAQFNYVRQLALYREAVRQNEDRVCRVGIIAQSKANPADLRVFPWQTNAYSQIDDAIANVLSNINYVSELRESDPEDLSRCERCDYCIESRQDYVFPYADPERKQKGW